MKRDDIPVTAMIGVEGNSVLKIPNALYDVRKL